MGAFFTRERFGRPQYIAGCLLLAYLAQCAWLIARLPSAVGPDESFRVREGLKQWRGKGIAGTPQRDAELATQVDSPFEAWTIASDGYDHHHSPLWYLTAAASVLPLDSQSSELPRYLGFVLRLPYLVFGALLGASVWYVSRRLYGNPGGYITLSLYCFSPGIIRVTAVWFSQPEITAAWGAFGAIFTAIAVAHTLYAPREVVLWNWRRIGLLGLSLVLAIGNQFSLIVMAPLALGFMLYVAPARKAAASVIWAAGCAVGAFLLLASYFFHPQAFLLGLDHADFFPVALSAYSMSGAYGHLLAQIAQSSPALTVAFPTALLTYFIWRRTRYFGNTAPLLVAVLSLILGVGTPHYPGLGFDLVAVPFIIVFVSGIAADLLETRQRAFVAACVWGLLGANAVWNLWELARV